MITAKIGKITLSVFGAILLLPVISLFKADSFFGNLSETSQALLVLVSVIMCCVSIGLIFYNSAPAKRKRVIKILSITTGSMFFIGWIFKFMHWQGAAILVVVSCFLFSFACLPLIIKSRYENRKTLLTNAVILLSFADLLSICCILLGVLFRILHWNAGTYLALTGAVILMITFIFWNMTFRKEVKLRVNAEEKLKETLHEIEEKQKEIKDSINYAKRIQEAILPSLDFIKSNLPNSFVYYQPKDIVAGDFYWAEKVGTNFFIAAADCTGHGVPGALVSVVCCNALNRAVNEFKLVDPGKILDKTRELVVESFSKSKEDIKDGMDISLIRINDNLVEWAGANNPLWHLKSTSNDPSDHFVLQEIKANKQAIGKTDHPVLFNTHIIHAQKGDLLYLFTDGFTDQFGGPKGKKFMYRQLKELLVSQTDLDLNTQQVYLKNTLNQWKGNLEQVDDICIIGIQF